VSADIKVILLDLYEQTAFAKHSVDRSMFRVRHEQSRVLIDRCERTGHIRRDNDTYFMSLMGIAELGDIPQAVEFFANAELLYLHLQLMYRKKPNALIPVVDISASIGIDCEVAMNCLLLMTDCNGWYGGRSEFTDSATASISPSEGILDRSTFIACVERMRELRSQFEFDIALPQLPQMLNKSDNWLTGISSVKSTNRDLTGKLPESLARLLAEVYEAIDYQLFTLASMGLRALIDTVILDKVGDAGTFKEKLKALHIAGYIATQQLDVLGAAIDTGNASSHRGFTPEVQDIEMVQAIVEHLLQSVYIHPENAKVLAKRTPKRHSV
jgi:hypothetical protein